RHHSAFSHVNTSFFNVHQTSFYIFTCQHIILQCPPHIILHFHMLTHHSSISTTHHSTFSHVTTSLFNVHQTSFCIFTCQHIILQCPPDIILHFHMSTHHSSMSTRHHSAFSHVNTSFFNVHQTSFYIFTCSLANIVHFSHVHHPHPLFQ